MTEDSSNKAYSPEEVETKWAKNWLDQKLFAVQVRPETKANPETKPFSIALPPPNVTGELHMGHALSGTIQDVLIRYNRMQGKDVLWQIGTDHAGIGTQIVVEKFIKKNEKINRHDLGREKFIERVKDWKDEYGNKILAQMQKLGFSPDWDRCRYTMDDHYSQAVKIAFKKYFDEDLIYRGKRVVNWCPKCQTSLSDLEIEKEETQGKLYHIKYPIKGHKDKFIVVATTRPETLFGDSGVAVHPSDERYKDLVKEQAKLILPFSTREIPLVADEHVKPEFGTGAVKVTPAHDANDFDIGQRNDLAQIIIMDEQAKMLTIDEVPEWLHGLDRFDARKLTVEKLEELELFDKITEYDQEKDSHDRCHTLIEPYLSDQWYVNMDHADKSKSLAKIALDTISSEQARFLPARYETIFKNWLEGIRDWCISRQIWWGHRIPVFYYKDAAYKNEHGHYPYFVDIEASSDNLPSKDPRRDLDLKDFEVWQDEDVLDTWFSSALWPFETLKADSNSQETSEVFEHFYPTSVLATAREIINLWVTRMIYSSQFFEDTAPYSDILIHPVVQTPDGKRMSKSKGNAIDPLEMVSQYGADASRMWYASVGIYGPQDVRFPGKYDKSKKQWSSDTLEQYKRFANKLFNASKFVMMNLDNGSKFVPQKIEDLDKTKLNIADKWILDKFHSLLAQIENGKDFDLALLANGTYEFLWFNFCDWYIELSKNNLSEESKQILFHILEASLRALHPVMPFITEEIWQVLNEKYDMVNLKSEFLNENLDDKYQASICFAKFPKSKAEFISQEQSSPVDYIVKVISAIRNSRQTLGIAWTNEVQVHLNTEDAYELNSIQEGAHFIKAFTKASDIVVNGSEAAKPSSSSIVDKTKLTIPLAGLVDINKVQDSTKKKIQAIEKDMKGLENRLKSENFIKNAAPEKIQETQEQFDALNAQKDLYERELGDLV